ncbi:MAG: CpaE family protein [Candidatus Limnocylindrales bacterium]
MAAPDHPIRLLLVDDIEETLVHLSRLFEMEPDLEVVGTATSGPQAIELARSLLPDVVLMDINMPGMDGIVATERLLADVPSASVVMLSVQGEREYIHRAMLAGASEFVEKPFSAEAIAAVIRSAYAHGKANRDRQVQSSSASPVVPAARGQLVTVAGTRGGIGRTTIAINTAVALAARLGQPVGLLDGHLQFGDIGIRLNAPRDQLTLVDVAGEGATVDPELFDRALVRTPGGVCALMAPRRPEDADRVTPALLGSVIDTFASRFPVTLADTPAHLTEHALSLIERADLIVLVSTLGLSSISAANGFLALVERFDLPPGRIVLVGNRVGEGHIHLADAERALGRSFDLMLPHDRDASDAADRGKSIVEWRPTSDLAKGFHALGELLAARLGVETRVPAQPRSAVHGRVAREQERPASAT